MESNLKLICLEDLNCDHEDEYNDLLNQTVKLLNDGELICLRRRSFIQFLVIINRMAAI